MVPEMMSRLISELAGMLMLDAFLLFLLMGCNLKLPYFFAFCAGHMFAYLPLLTLMLWMMFVNSL